MSYNNVNVIIRYCNFIILDVRLLAIASRHKHTGKDKDYEAYKEALNAATNEVRKSKRNVSTN